MIAETISHETLTLEIIRHTCTHVLAMAVQNLFPETKVTIVPVTETGFYYYFDRETAQCDRTSVP